MSTPLAFTTAWPPNKAIHRSAVVESWARPGSQWDQPGIGRPDRFRRSLRGATTLAASTSLFGDGSARFIKSYVDACLALARDDRGGEVVSSDAY